MNVSSITPIVFAYKTKQGLAENKTLQTAQVDIELKGLYFLTSSPSLIKKTILYLFYPYCNFCQAHAKQFRRFHTRLKDFVVLWASYDVKDSINKFSKIYRLDTLPNMHFAYMDIEAIMERYGNVKFPTFLAYDEQGHLLKKFVGLTKPEKILKVYQME